MKKRRKYWYLMVRAECPVCGRDHSYRERRYSPRPKDARKRYKYVVDYDWCEMGPF
jgi:hypothetical protein